MLWYHPQAKGQWMHATPWTSRGGGGGGLEGGVPPPELENK